MAGEHLGEDAGVEVGDDVPGRRHGRIDRGGDVDGAVAVDAADGGEAASRLDDGDLAEGHLAAVGGADAHVLVEVAERAALVARVADHDADVVAAALDALRLLAVEGLAHLLPEVLEREAEGLGGGLDAELHLLLAGAEGVGHLVDAGVLAEPPLDVVGHRPQAAQVGAGELHVDVAPPAPPGQREVHRHGLRDGLGRLAPQEPELLAAVARVPTRSVRKYTVTPRGRSPRVAHEAVAGGPGPPV